MDAELIFALLSVFIVSASSFDLTVSPSTTAVKKENENTVFTCSVTGDKGSAQVNLAWYKTDGKTIIADTNTGSRVYVELIPPNVLKLYIKRIEVGDSGVYRCEGSTADGTTLERTIELQTYQGIQFDTQPIQNPVLNSDALIKCKATGVPKPSISWTFNWKKLSIGDKYDFREDGLLVRGITEEDNGDYVCNAEVLEMGSTDERVIKVEVHVPPTITKSLKEVERVKEGDKAMLVCEAVGKPAPKFRFYKTDSAMPLLQNDHFTIDEDSGILEIKAVKQSDGGQYRCEAFNDAGAKSAEGNLFIIVPPRVTSFPAQVASEDQDVTLACEVTADPKAHLSIRKVTGQITYTEGDNDGGRIQLRVVGDNKLELHITKLKSDDTGDYECEAHNEGGHVTAETRLTVQFSPRFDEDAVKTFYAWAGSKGNVTCAVEAEPAPELTWYDTQGQEIVNSNTFTVVNSDYTSHLVVTVREDEEASVYGAYRCSAKNSQGSNDITLTLKQATVPGIPKSVTVNFTTPTSVDFIVQLPEDNGGIAVHGYQIEYNSKLQNVYLVGGDTGNYYGPIRVEGLTPSSKYMFIIRAINEVGQGDGYEVEVETPQQRAPYPIKIVSDAQGLMPNEYTVQWERPMTGGLPIEKYEIKYRKVLATEVADAVFRLDQPVDNTWMTHTFTDTPDHPHLSHKLGQLTHKAYYQVSVRASNPMGWSDSHEDFVFRTAIGDAVAPQTATAGSSAVIMVVVIIVFLLFLVIIDISCYFLNSCGVLMLICQHVCGKKPSDHHKQMEEGESKPLTSDADHADEYLEPAVNNKVESAPPLSMTIISEEDFILPSKNDNVESAPPVSLIEDNEDIIRPSTGVDTESAPPVSASSKAPPTEDDIKTPSDTTPTESVPIQTSEDHVDEAPIEEQKTSEVEASPSPKDIDGKVVDDANNAAELLDDNIQEKAEDSQPSESEVVPPPEAEPEADVTSPPEPEAKVTSPSEPDADVTSPPEPEANVTSPPEPEAEVTSPSEPEADVTLPPEPEAKVTSPPEPETNVTSPPEVETVPPSENETKGSPIAESEVAPPEPEAGVPSEPEAAGTSSPGLESDDVAENNNSAPVSKPEDNQAVEDTSEAEKDKEESNSDHLAKEAEKDEEVGKEQQVEEENERATSHQHNAPAESKEEPGQPQEHQQLSPGDNQGPPDADTVPATKAQTSSGAVDSVQQVAT